MQKEIEEDREVLGQEVLSKDLSLPKDSCSGINT